MRNNQTASPHAAVHDAHHQLLPRHIHNDSIVPCPGQRESRARCSDADERAFRCTSLIEPAPARVMPALASRNAAPEQLAQHHRSRESAPLRFGVLDSPSILTLQPHSTNNALRVALREVTAVMKRHNSSNNKSILHFFKSVPRTSSSEGSTSPGTAPHHPKTPRRVVAASG